jgi:hypothetical protein
MNFSRNVFLQLPMDRGKEYILLQLVRTLSTEFIRRRKRESD